MSPFQALYGYEPPAREMVLTEATQVAAVEEWMQRRINMDQLIKGLLEGARNRMRQVADRRRSEMTFLVGDWVFSKASTLQAGQCHVQEALQVKSQVLWPLPNP
jgi:hypothetical protein